MKSIYCSVTEAKSIVTNTVYVQTVNKEFVNALTDTEVFFITGALVEIPEFIPSL